MCYIFCKTSIILPFFTFIKKVPLSLLFNSFDLFILFILYDPYKEKSIDDVIAYIYKVINNVYDSWSLSKMLITVGINKSLPIMKNITAVFVYLFIEFEILISFLSFNLFEINLSFFVSFVVTQVCLKN